jgi:hypothetical protein
VNVISYGERIIATMGDQREASMARTPRFGRITPAEFEWRSANVRRYMTPRKAEEHIAALRLLVDDPARDVRASAPAGDDMPDEFASLWPPKTPEEAERRQARAEAERVAAAAGLDDADEDELYADAIRRHWPAGTRP